VTAWSTSIYHKSTSFFNSITVPVLRRQRNQENATTPMNRSMGEMNTKNLYQKNHRYSWTTEIPRAVNDNKRTEIVSQRKNFSKSVLNVSSVDEQTEWSKSARLLTKAKYAAKNLSKSSRELSDIGRGVNNNIQKTSYRGISNSTSDRRNSIASTPKRTPWRF